MCKPILLSFLFTFIYTCSNSQNLQIEKQLDELFSREFKPSEPGCAILVTKNGQVVYKKAFGSADLELNVPLAPDMVFNLASITKQFTAVAILQLAEQGKISLQDSLQKFVPDFPSHGQKITIENLLTHTSGIRDYMQINYSGLYMERWDFSPKQLIDSFKNYSLIFEPGTKYSYSNSGYYLLGYITEKISGKAYENYVREHILVPLGLDHTYFDSEGIIIQNRVNGYQKAKEGYKNADYWSPTIAYAAGGLLANTEDLFKWFKGISSYKIIKKETLEKAFTPFTLKDGKSISYGYGWSVHSSGGIKSIEHGGNMSGFTTNEIYYPEQDVFIAILFNSQDAPRDKLSREVSEIALGGPLQEGVMLNNTVLDTYVGTYRLSTDTNRTMVVTRKDKSLFANFSGQQTFEVILEKDGKFGLKGIRNMTGAFINEAGKVTRVVIEQDGEYQWNRVE